MSDNLKRAEQIKSEANNLYKNKQFDEATQKYLEAASLDPTNMVYHSNIGAVYFEQGEYQKSIESCIKALEIGMENRADFKLKARALQRVGNCYHKMNDLENAIVYYNKSLIEEHNKQTYESLKKTEKELEDRKLREYISPELSDKARNEGNDFFKKGNYPEAVKSYSEAIKRNPLDKVPYTNRATAYIKLGAIPDAIRDCEKAIELDGKYVKAYIKKAHAHNLARDHLKALETYQKAIELEPTNQEVENGIKNVMEKIGQGQDEETVKRNVQNNPELIEILQDPLMRTVLQDLEQNNKEAVVSHLRNPEIKKKIDKLIAAGIIKLGN
jgi:stress-induced-phosphoprotein 1